MKKTISLIVALAMVFVMCIPAFAEGEEVVKPTDPTELGVYYAELLNAEDSDPAVVAQMILDDLIVGEGDEGIYTVDDLPTVLTAFAENSTDVEKLAAAAEQITAGLESMGIVLPEIPELPELPGGEGDGNLPEDEEPTDDTDFLNTILGILGSIGDMIFGSGDETPSEPSDGDEAFPDDEANPDGDSDDLISDTGDTTVISVAAVALVAGAALVLTRKKSEDAE